MDELLNTRYHDPHVGVFGCARAKEPKEGRGGKAFQQEWEFQVT